MPKVNLGKKSDVTIVLHLDISDSANPRVLTETEDAALPKELPPTIFKVKSTWARLNFALSHIVDVNSYVERQVNGRVHRMFDASMMVYSQIRVLLKSWNLDELDEGFKLTFVTSEDNPKIKILADETMNKIGELNPPAIINLLYAKALDNLGKPVKVEVEEAVEVKN